MHMLVRNERQASDIYLRSRTGRSSAEPRCPLPGAGRDDARRMGASPDYATVEVERVDDHRQAGVEVDSGIGGRWVDDDEQRAQRGGRRAGGAGGA